MRQLWNNRHNNMKLSMYYVFFFASIWTYFSTAQRLASGHSKMCGRLQEYADLDCQCFLRDLPCRVPGSICVQGIGASDMRCQCSSPYGRELDKYCVERISPDTDVISNEDPNTPETNNTVKITADPTGTNPLFRLDGQLLKPPSPKRPFKKPPFKTVMVTSSPLHAITRPNRLFPRPSLSHALHGIGVGIGFGSPTIDSILSNSFPRTRPPYFPSKSKSTTPIFNKGHHQVTKRPPSLSPATRFFSRSTKHLAPADGSVMANGWFDTQRIWPAVGLNYSI